MPQHPQSRLRPFASRRAPFTLRWLLFRAAVAGLAMGVAVGAMARAGEEEGPWPAEVEGFVAPAAGEHPRLFFRKADVPELRARAETPEGRAIVARLRRLLGGGEKLPERYNEHFPVNISARGPAELPPGSFTMSHAAGYGMLYQLTGQKKYAELARQCLEMTFDADRYSVTYAQIKAERAEVSPKLFNYEERLAKEGKRVTAAELAQKVLHYGQPDRDERYTWTTPGAKLRIGPMMLAVAMAYDLCYDGWDDAFRRRVVAELLDYDRLPVDFDMYSEGHKGRATMEAIVNCGYPPESNHFGAYIGGAGTALLAVRGDPGADDQRVRQPLATIEKNTLRLLSEGFGDHGFFAEGQGPSHMAANSAFVPFLQAARTAWGKDFIAPRPHAQWLTLRWAMEIVPGADGRPYYPNLYPSSYGPQWVDRDGLSDGGDFAQGFGALAGDDQRAALLWVYRRLVEPGEVGQNPTWLEAGERSFDAVAYPHRAVLALVNWPMGLEPKNPAEVIGRVNVDRYMGYYMFRKGWAGPDDVYFTLLTNPRGKHGYVKGPRGGNFAFWGLGLRTKWSQKLSGVEQTYFKAEPDGSGVVSLRHDGGLTSIAIDYSERAGVPAVVVFANPWFSEDDQTKTDWHRLRSVTPKEGRPGPSLVYRRVQAGATSMLVATLSAGPPPELSVRDGKLAIGRQTYAFDGQKLVMGEQ
jgi:hypothetical protein